MDRAYHAVAAGEADVWERKMREITDHIFKSKERHLNVIVEAIDDPLPLSASNVYRISGYNRPGIRGEEGEAVSAEASTTLTFQVGIVSQQSDLNGITEESLLAIVLDRFSKPENEDGTLSFEQEQVIGLLKASLLWIYGRKSNSRKMIAESGSPRDICMSRTKVNLTDLEPEQIVGE